ncbi:MAG: hypothetical protein U9Q40_05690 [Campylobacterota bacterium]|nr:hypothetical protein [Campylobacterota bacterium]
MISFNKNEIVEEREEEYDYTNEEPLEEEPDYEYEEQENDYCD